jgi:hypothetical protein
MNYKKPAFWIIILALIVCVVATIRLLSAPKGNDSETTNASNSTLSSSPSSSQNVSPSASETPTPKGETKRYTYQNLAIELTNVKSERTEAVLADGLDEWQYTVITYYPGATLTVIKADMSDPTYSADGQAHPEWAILLDPADPTQRIDIVDDMQPLNITSDMRGIFDPESSLYVFAFEEYSE